MSERLVVRPTSRCVVYEREAAIYIQRMVTTQLNLIDDVHRRLRELAQKQGRTISDLVREAIARANGPGHEEARISTLEGITGLGATARTSANP